MAKWFKCSEELPKGNYHEGIVVNCMPNPRTALYGYFGEGDNRKLGFHSGDYGKEKECKVDMWMYFDFPNNYK